MSQLIWTQQALSDVQRLYRFLAEKDLNAARNAVKEIRASVRILESQAQLGRPVEELGTDFREWLIKFGSTGYVVLYRIDGELTVMLAIRHQREIGWF
ncbi:type II toxin-antitoxin system RelE/ParE family toxin [Klebsiella aerogenes]|uniref:type II toxin-antitoxin system RelE/ParE family toxin n=1 Tax=Klebsiella aerogenes TaxID=548 RepID=UPI000666F022|nr:type II toxin-antitoxin system RelE/ParE family toxin [Klebsiella aerogenes]